MNQFLGYAGNKVQSEKKLLRDVFKDGDVYFNTGDLLLQDDRDFLYFRDRIGDTFRYHYCLYNLNCSHRFVKEFVFLIITENDHTQCQCLCWCHT